MSHPQYCKSFWWKFFIINKVSHKLFPRWYMFCILCCVSVYMSLVNFFYCKKMFMNAEMRKVQSNSIWHVCRRSLSRWKMRASKKKSCMINLILLSKLTSINFFLVFHFFLRPCKCDPVNRNKFSANCS